MINPTPKHCKKPCWLYVPETFDPKSLPANLQQHADSARYLLHRIIWGQIIRKRTIDNYVPLKFDYLREVIPDRVILPLKNALIAEGVVECDRQYIEGRKSLGYRLGQSCREARIIRVAVENNVTAKKIQASRKAKYKKVRLDVHVWLRSQFRRLDVDLPLALSLLSGHRRLELVKIPVEQIANKDAEFSVCRYGRVHTSLTRCSGRVRPALNVFGEGLVSLDIANSQPLFLSLLVINYRKQGGKTCGYVTFTKTSVNQYKEIDKIIEETVPTFDSKKEIRFSKSSSSSSYSSSPPISSNFPAYTTRKASRKEKEIITGKDFKTMEEVPLEVLVNNHVLSSDEQRFLKLCEQGVLYQTLKEEMRSVEMPLQSQKWIKSELFEVLFGRNRSKSRLKEIFKEMFPGVAEVIRVHKRKDYRFLPRLLQNIEANCIINCVCRRLMDEMPDIPVYTIHDSVLTTRPYVEPVRQIIFDEFGRLGLTPTLHETDYGALP